MVEQATSQCGAARIRAALPKMLRAVTPKTYLEAQGWVRGPPTPRDSGVTESRWESPCLLKPEVRRMHHAVYPQDPGSTGGEAACVAETSVSMVSGKIAEASFVSFRDNRTGWRIDGLLERAVAFFCITNDHAPLKTSGRRWGLSRKRWESGQAYQPRQTGRYYI